VSDEAGALHRGQVRHIVSGVPSIVIVVVAIAGNYAAHSALWRYDPRASLAMCLVYFSGGLCSLPLGRHSAAVLSCGHTASTLAIQPIPGACLMWPLFSRRSLATLPMTTYRAARWSDVMMMPVAGAAIAQQWAVSVSWASRTVASFWWTATSFKPQSLSAFY
jgi:hypothetical protein